MANEIIRPAALPVRTNPVPSEVVPSDNNTIVAGVTWENGVNAAVPPATQMESEAGVINTKRMTPLTTKQAIDAQVPPKISSAIAGLNLGSAAQAQVSDFATAAQGSLADTAVQPSRTVATGAGLTGGGTLATDQTIALNSASIASLAKADTSVQTVNGNSPDGSGNVVIDAEFTQEQDSRTSALLATFAPTVEWVQTAGYASAGDGGNALYKRVSSEPSHAGKFQSADGAWWELAENVIRPEHFGAKGDGVTDDTAAIAVADAYCRSFTPYKTLQFSAKTYLVDQMVIHIGSKWKGHGKNGTVILQQIGANKDLFYGVNSDSNWDKDGQTATGFPYDFEIDGFDLDGNWNGGPAYMPGTPGNVSGGGFAVCGDHYIVRDLYIRNVAGIGVRKKFIGDSGINYDRRYLETSWNHIRVDYCGADGWVDEGPHDSYEHDVIVLDAGQAAENTFDGFLFQPLSSGRHVGFHAASRAGRRRMRYALNINDNVGHEFSGGSQFEGAATAPLRLAASNCIFDPSTRFYATFGGATIIMEGNCVRNIIRGQLDGFGGSADPYGVVIGGNPADVVVDNDVDLFMHGQNGGAVVFQQGDKGRNTFRIRGIFADSATIIGTPHPSTRVDFNALVNNSTQVKFDTWDQSLNVAIAAGTEYTWTFPYPFPDFPNVQVSIGATAAVPTMPLYITALTLTSVTVRNGNSSGMPAFISAKAL